MGGFFRVVDYKPFCKYTLNVDGYVLPTYEWDKINPEARFKELQTEDNVRGLTKLL